MTTLARSLLKYRDSIISRKVLRLWIYFRRAHNNYMVLAVWLASQSTIFYTLLMVQILGVPKSILHYILFAFLFAVSYFIVAVLVGRWDFKRGSVRVETELIARANPAMRDILFSLYRIADKLELQDVKEVLKKWIEEY